MGQAMDADENIRVTLLDVPEGNVRGFVSAYDVAEGDGTRLAHATLFIDGPPKITFTAPLESWKENLSRQWQIMELFAKTINELDSARNKRR